MHSMQSIRHHVVAESLVGHARRNLSAAGSPGLSCAQSSDCVCGPLRIICPANADGTAAGGVEKSFIAETGDPLTNHVHGLTVHDFGGDVGHASKPLKLHSLQNQGSVWFAGDEDGPDQSD